jgi:hypothetical protein
MILYNQISRVTKQQNSMKSDVQAELRRYSCEDLNEDQSHATQKETRDMQTYHLLKTSLSLHL